MGRVVLAAAFAVAHRKAVVPVVEPAVAQQPTPVNAVAALPVVEVAPVTATTPRALPATGNSVSVLLLFAGLLVAVGSTAVRFARPTSGSDENAA